MTKQTIDFDDLLEYSNLMDDEFGEYCLYLGNLGIRVDMMSKGFRKAYTDEFNRTLKCLKENTKIVEKKETITRMYDELEWIGENYE